MNQQQPNNQPHPVFRRCFFCGKNKPVRTRDPFLLKVIKREKGRLNGRSFNFCTWHWKKLRRYATPQEIEQYRRHQMPKDRVGLAWTIKKLQAKGMQ